MIFQDYVMSQLYFVFFCQKQDCWIKYSHELQYKVDS